MNDKKYIEKKVRKYVLATLDQPTLYLLKHPFQKEYLFTDDIEAATKTIKMDVAQYVRNFYYMDTGAKIDLVIIPIDITYELIDETN